MIDRFHKALHAKIEELAARKRDTLAIGLGSRAEEIALNYKHSVGYLQALVDVGDAAAEVEKQIYHPEKGAD